MRNTIRILSGSMIWLAVMSAGCNTRRPFNSSDGAAAQPPAAASQAEAIRQGLATFQKLVTPANFAKLGFAAVSDPNRAQTSEPLAIRMIELNAIKNYRPGQDAAAMLVDTKRSLFPVVVDEKVVSSIALTQSSDGWRATDFGNASMARAATAFRRDPQDFLVQVPALKLNFIARRSDGAVQLTAIADNEQYGFQAGETLSLPALLENLQRAAKGYNGLPQ